MEVNASIGERCLDIDIVLRLLAAPDLCLEMAIIDEKLRQTAIVIGYDHTRRVIFAKQWPVIEGTVVFRHKVAQITPPVSYVQRTVAGQKKVADGDEYLHNNVSQCRKRRGECLPYKYLAGHRDLGVSLKFTACL